MKVFYSLDALPTFRHAVVTIGSFDGVHAGHQHILETVKRLAREGDGESVVVTFEPHPRLVLKNLQNIKNGEISLALLTTIEEKIDWLQYFGIENVVVVPFTKAFSDQSPDDYIEHFLIEKLQPQQIVIGYDHRFGANRMGDISYLKKFEKKYNFNVLEIEKQLIDDIAVSSTKIRRAIESADIAAAVRLLNHAFTFSGTVVKGNQLGRTIGFPTANIDVKSPYKLVPKLGVYAVWITIGGKKYQGMMNRGTRPTVSQTGNVTIEVHVLDFQDDIYDQQVTVELVAFLRPEQAFDGLDALKKQLKRDAIHAKKVLKKEISHRIEEVR